MRSWLGPSVALLVLSGCTALGLFGDAPPAARPVLDPDLVQRGHALFLDARLSGDGSRTCSTCHPGGGADARVYLDGESVPPGSAGGRRPLTL
ncbi:MAG: cytochrome c peroxidase, partial [Myxococcota bacterium]